MTPGREATAGPGGEPGVYYRREDYIGVGRRLLIDAIDVPIAVLLSAAAIGGVALLAPSWVEAGAALFIVVAVWVAYFVILKRSRFRTLGYVVAGARIVDLRGGRPSVVSLLMRLVFAVAGPINVLMDLMWITGDRHRQSMRDKFASTYVVKKDARPAGSGPIVHRTYMVWGSTYLFKEVKATEPS